MEVRGAVVLVTGASSGIGRATALAFDRAGARVALAARRLARLEAIAAEMSDALVLRTDLSVDGAAETMVARTVERFGRLDVLVNNAGAAAPRPADRLTAASTRALLETNLVAAMVATRAAAEQMRRQGAGHVINVCSPAGFLGIPGMADYCASKAAMSGWTRALQAEWAGTGIAVTEYLPGLIATELGHPVADGEDGGGPDRPGDGPGRSARRRGDDEPARRAGRPDGGGGAPEGGAAPGPGREDRRRGTGAAAREGAARVGPLSALPPERVADQIVACVRRPRLVVYSDIGARFVTWLSRSPRLRRAIGAAIARAARRQRA